MLRREAGPVADAQPGARVAVEKYVLPKPGGVPVDQVGTAAVYEVLRPVALAGRHAMVKTTGAAITPRAMSGPTRSTTSSPSTSTGRSARATRSRYRHERSVTGARLREHFRMRQHEFSPWLTPGGTAPAPGRLHCGQGREEIAVAHPLTLEGSR